MSSTDSNLSRGQVFQRELGIGGFDPRLRPKPTPPAEQFETRQQDYSNAAFAAGAQRTGSDSDLLGFIGPRARRAGQARRILGD